MHASVAITVGFTTQVRLHPWGQGHDCHGELLWPQQNFMVPGNSLYVSCFLLLI